MSEPGDVLVMADQPPGTRPCSVAAALEILGERWSLLAVREIGYGVHRFSKIAAYTGASRDLLADRLRKLEAAGIVERHQYSEHPPRYEYHLTQAGLDLFPVILALMSWGDRYLAGNGGPPLVLEHKCGHWLGAEVVCESCREPVTASETRPASAGSRPLPIPVG